MFRIKNPNFLMIGGFLICVAALALYLSRGLSTFNASGMGAGFIPHFLSAVLLALGVILIALSFKSQSVSSVIWPLRPWLVIVAIGYFAATITDLGLIVAVVGLVLISSLANRQTNARDAILLAAGSALFCWIVFVKALGLTLPLWPVDFWSL